MDISKERRNRIRLCLAALQYERYPWNLPYMDDDTWNKLAHSIRPEISTGNEKVDEFFRTVFEPYTGSWITKHPELDKLNELHLRLQKDMSQRE